MVTSQNFNEIVQLTTTSLFVRPLETEVASELFLSRLGGSRSASDMVATQDLNFANKIVDKLSGIPLAISTVAGAYCGLQPGEIWRLLSDHCVVSIAGSVSTAATYQYEKTLETVLDQSERALSLDSLQLVRILAMLSPVGVQENILFSGDGDLGLPFMDSSNPRVYEIPRHTYETDC